jgi:hypothetical protein
MSTNTKSKIITKTSEIAERTLTINHTVSDGQSLLIGVKDKDGKTKILLEIEAGSDYEVNLTGTITDKKVFGI